MLRCFFICVFASHFHSLTALGHAGIPSYTYVSPGLISTRHDKGLVDGGEVTFGKGMGLAAVGGTLKAFDSTRSFGGFFCVLGFTLEAGLYLVSSAKPQPYLANGFSIGVFEVLHFAPSHPKDKRTTFFSIKLPFFGDDDGGWGSFKPIWKE